MTFLPISTRELRVASRRPLTFRIRWIAAAFGAFATFIFVLGSGGRLTGAPLLDWLAGSAFFAAGMSGLILTADSLSEERREGTLGLLFLTGLAGYDLVIGKLLVTGLNALMALAALLPVLAFTWILGGVTGSELWRISLALLNTLWVSLALGLLVSAGQRKQRYSLAITFFVLLILIFGLGAIHAFLMFRKPPPADLWFCGLSPWAALQWAPDKIHRTAPDSFWQALVFSHGLGWLFIFAASVVVRWVHLAPETGVEVSKSLSVGWMPGSKTFHLARTRKMMSLELLDENPLMALLLTRSSIGSWVWALVILIMAVLVVNALVGGQPAMPVGFGIMSLGRLGLTSTAILVTGLVGAIKALYAWQACDFFVSGRRDQSLEALLTTPIGNRQLVNGVRLALRRQFVWPLGTLAVVVTIVTWIHSLTPNRMAAGSGVSPEAIWGSWLYTMITLPLDFAALSWMGLWFALKEPRPQWAFAKTVGFGILLPLVLFLVPSALVTGCCFGYAQAQLRRPVRAILEANPQRANLDVDRAPFWKRPLYGGIGGG